MMNIQSRKIAESVYIPGEEMWSGAKADAMDNVFSGASLEYTQKEIWRKSGCDIELVGIK